MEQRGDQLAAHALAQGQLTINMPCVGERPGEGGPAVGGHPAMGGAGSMYNRMSASLGAAGAAFHARANGGA